MCVHLKTHKGIYHAKDYSTARKYQGLHQTEKQIATKAMVERNQLIQCMHISVRVYVYIYMYIAKRKKRPKMSLLIGNCR